MKLSSVQALKRELLSVPQRLVEQATTATSFQAFQAQREATDRVMNRIALGVTPSGKRGFHLAVRPQRSGPLTSAMVEQIRHEARGEVDVQYIGSIVKLAKRSTASPTQARYYRQRRRPLRIGSSISDVNAEFESAGTLGCFVVQRSSARYLGMLTNNHVIANENLNSRGTPIVQPGTLDRGAAENDVVGELGRFVKLEARRSNRVDAAFGHLYEEIEYDPRKIGNLGLLSGIADVPHLRRKAPVFKVGRTTGQTAGRLTAFDVDNVSVEYDQGVFKFDGQIEIEGAGNRAFSDAGDSGSLIVDERVRAIGLLFAGGDTGGSNGRGLTYANPITAVLDALQVDLEL
jgi:hypothetical protein